VIKVGSFRGKSVNVQALVLAADSSDMVLGLRENNDNNIALFEALTGVSDKTGVGSGSHQIKTSAEMTGAYLAIDLDVGTATTGTISFEIIVK